MPTPVIERDPSMPTHSLLHGKGLTRTTARGWAGRWICVGGGDSTSWLWGFKSVGGLDHYAHVLNQHKLLVVG
jgi:hypothetical protein